MPRTPPMPRHLTVRPTTAGRRVAPRRPGGTLRPGFTLIEAALTTVIIGTGVLAILAAQQAYHQKNNWAQRSGTAMLLANELRELALTLPVHDPFTSDAYLGPETNECPGGVPDVTLFDDLDDFAGKPDLDGSYPGTLFDPPINALRQGIAEVDAYFQYIVVENVLPDNISYINPQPLGTTDAYRVRVQVYYMTPETRAYLRDPGTPASEKTDDKKIAASQMISQITWVVLD